MQSKLLILLSILYPLVTHFAILLHHSVVSYDYFILLLAFIFYDTLYKRHLSYGITIAILIIAVGVALRFTPLFAHVILLPPILISLLLLSLFGRSLLPGHTPLITAFAKQVHPEPLSKTYQQYTQSVTWLWCVISGAMFIETICLAIWVSPTTWSWFCNIINYLILLACLVIEYIYRLCRFGRPPQSFMAFITKLITINWREL